MPLFPYTSVRHRRMNYYWHMTQRAKCPGEWKETFLCHPARPGMRSRTIVGATLGSPCDRALPPCTHRLAKPCHSRGDALCSPSTPCALTSTLFSCPRPPYARPVTRPIQLALSFASRVLERIPVFPASLSSVIGGEGAQPLGIFP